VDYVRKVRGFLKCEKVVAATIWVLKFVVDVLGLCDELVCGCCFYCYCHYTPSPLHVRMSSNPPTITIITRNNNLFIICCVFMLYTRMDKKQCVM
jgi:hypothetical protein